MQFFLLGRVHATQAGRPVHLGRKKQRLILALLALEANRRVTTDRLIDLVWPQDPPASARGMIHTYISRLRDVLAECGVHEEGVGLGHEQAGYVLRCDPARIDAYRFRALLAEARDGDDEGRVALLSQAVALWRWPALAGVVDEDVRIRLSIGLEEARIAAHEDLVEARQRLGRRDGLLDELLEWAGKDPLRPRLVGALMRELHHAGRTAEALATYRHVREGMREELGLDPPEQLRDLHQALLCNDPGLATAAVGSASVGAASVPRQLPGDLPAFTGRADELDQLLAVGLDTAFASDPRGSTAVVITAIDGMGGIGKTALAVHAGHRLADRFPDGQLFIDMHGFARDVPPVDPADALEQMLRSLGVSGERIPRDLDARAAFYRTRLAGKHVLIVLDNVVDEGQAQPLLPGAGDCLVLITSRRRLAGLDNAQPLSLDVLSVTDAQTLFTRIAGEGHLTEMIKEIAELCGRLPLAIRIAAARLRARPAWPAAHLADRLRDRRHRLAELDTGDRSVISTIDLSYQHLIPEQRRLYRLLGLHPGPDIESYAAAALADTGPQASCRLLEDLVDAHLLDEPAPGRFRFHDLVRAHAADAVTRDETASDGWTALTRLYDHYAHTASLAMTLAYPYDVGSRPGMPPSGTPTPPLNDETRATAWLDGELANLLATSAHAADNGRPGHTMHLSATLDRHLQTRDRYAEAETLHSMTLDLAHKHDNHADEVTALNGLGYAHLLQGRYGPATGHFERALKIARSIGYRAGELSALLGLGDTHCLLGQYAPATEHFQRALEIALTTGNRAYELAMQCGLGLVNRLQGRYGPAIKHYQRSLEIARRIGNRNSQFEALHGLGRAHRSAGHPDLALTCHQNALDLACDLGQLGDQARARDGLAFAHGDLGQDDRARAQWLQALDILTRLNVSQSEELSAADIRAMLTDLDTSKAASG